MTGAPLWAETVDYLVSRDPDGGATWEEACAHFGITRAGWRQRISAVRDMVEAHPEAGYVLPRPTRENGFRYRVTNRMLEIGKADIRSGHIDDNINALGILRRMYGEAMTAYEQVVAEEPGGKRSKKAKKIFPRLGALAFLIDSFEKDQEILVGYPSI